MGILLNRVKANTATTGTGAATPGSAISSFKDWTGATPGYFYDYLIEDGTAWESGVGLWNGTILTRPGPTVDPQFESSTGALLILSGSATIACVANRNTLTAGGPFMPPMASSFTSESGNATALTLVDDPKAGLKVSLPGAVTANISVGAYRTLTTPAADWVMTAKFNWQLNATNWQWIGLYLHDTTGGRLVSWGPRNGNSQELDKTHWGSMTSWSGDNLNVVRGSMTWFQIEKSSTTAFYRTSADGQVWHTWYSESITTFVTASPNRVGLYAQDQNNVPIEFAVPYFSLTGSAV